MASEKLGVDPEPHGMRKRDRWIGVWIGVLAVMLAVCAMGGDNAAKDATLFNIETTNNWAFFQAKNMRRQVVRAQIEALETAITATPQMTDQTRRALEDKIKAHRKYEARLSSDEDGGQGLEQLYDKGKVLEEWRDEAMRKDPYFDYGQALLQIAIVLASVAIISGGNTLLAASGLLGMFGALLTLNGFTLAFSLPGLS